MIRERKTKMELTKRTVEEELIKVGVKPSFRGFPQLVNVIIEAFNTYDENDNFNLMKGPILTIAKRNGVKPSSIERNIRTAIEKTFENCDSDKIYEYFGNTIDFNKAKACNKDFVFFILMKLRWRLEDEEKR